MGGKAVVHTLAATVPAVANARHYAQIVRDTATYRGLIRAGTEIAQLGYERIGEPPELVDRAEQIVFGIADQRITGDFEHMETLLKESFDRITQLHADKRELTGIRQRLPPPRRAHRRLPELQPDRARRPARAWARPRSR